METDAVISFIVLQVEVSRLGSPYGKCTSAEDFMAKNKIKYTRTVRKKKSVATFCIKKMFRTPP